MDTHTIPSHYRTSALRGTRRAWADAAERGGGPDPRPIYVDNLAAPHCLIGNKPRSAKRGSLRPVPAEPRPADSMAQLRAWATKDLRWLRLSRWSRGIPALATPVRERHDDPILHPERMTVEEIDATREQEIPTVSREVYNEIGTEALSLDMASKPDAPEAGTIGEVIGAEALALLFVEVSDETMDPLWLDALEYALDNLHADEDEAAADEFNAEINVLAHQYVDEEIATLRNEYALRYGVAFDYPSPDVADRIEWEQYVARCSPVEREGFRILPDRVEVFSWVNDPDDTTTEWNGVRHLSLKERRDQFVARWLASHGMDALPPLAEWHKRVAVLRGIKHNPKVTEPNRIDFYHHFVAEQARALLTDDEAGMSSEVRDEPYVPSLALITYQSVQAAIRPFRDGTRDWADWDEVKAEARARALTTWQEIARSAPEPEIRHHCRNPRQHGGKDEPWHALPPQEDVDAPVALIGEAMHWRELAS